MSKDEPKVKANIIVRPAYTAKGEVYKTSSTRWIGEIYVYGKKVYTSIDLDCESAAFVACAKQIQWYQNEYEANFLIDAYRNELKNKPKSKQHE